VHSILAEGLYPRAKRIAVEVNKRNQRRPENVANDVIRSQQIMKTIQSSPVRSSKRVAASAVILLFALVLGSAHLSARQKSKTSPDNIVVQPGQDPNAQKAAPPPKGVRVYPGGIHIPPAQGALCSVIPGCVYPAPELTSAMPFSNLTPGGYVVVFGKHLNPPDGVTAGRVQFALGGSVHDLVDLQWSDTSVGGRVPDGWNWTDPQDVDLWIVRADGTKTAPLSPRPTFTPVYEVQMVHGSDLSEFHCAPSDDYNCDVSGTAQTAWTSHATTYGHDSGTDNYKIARLLNGWRAYEIEFTRFNMHDSTVQDPAGFNQGYDWFDVQVHWDQDGGSIIASHCAVNQYELKIYIRGPKGMPWK
jgi:hypothetical protein